MKNIIIIGASGSLAKVVTEELQKLADVHLTLFVRNRKRLKNEISQNTNIMEGDVLDYPVLKAAIDGQDIVYINLAGDLEAMGKNIVKAMHEAGVKRVIATSSIGIYNTPVKPILTPYRKLADIIESSGLDYTILRPDWFTDKNEIDYTITHKGEVEIGTALSRKSIAAFIASIVQQPDTYKNENVGISKPA